jgi:hypothetical protein
MKRITAAITALALPVAFLLLALPAKATPGDSIEFGGNTPTSGSTVQGNISGSVTAKTAISLKSFTLTLQGIDSAFQFTPIRLDGGNNGGSSSYPALPPTPSDTINFNWDSSSMSSNTPHNGKYTLFASAQTIVGDSLQKNNDININNPPLAPSGVNMTMQSEVPHISWAPNSEPDLLGYQVQRSADSGSYVTIATKQTTVFDDSNAPKGANLRYRIVASRYSPVSSAILSVPSAETAATYITPPAPAPVPGPATVPAPAPVVIAPAAAPKAPPITLPAAVAPQITPTAPKAVTAPALAAPQKRPQIRNEFLGGSTFSQTLPYPAVAPAAASQDSMPAMVGRKAVTAITRAVASVPKPRYLAVALMMLVLALHISRAARQLTTQQTQQA